MKIRCASCGGEIALKRDEAFLSCPFCSSSLYLDRAKTFRSLLISPVLTAVAAKGRLEEELARREVPPCSVRASRVVLAPFWGVRGESLQESTPAFSPVPPALQGYRLPSAGTVFMDAAAMDGYTMIPCSEHTSSTWEGRQDVSSFTLYHVPFYEMQLGAGRLSYDCWIDAVTGKVYLDQTPPQRSENISSRFLALVFVLFAAFTAAAAIVPGFGWSILAVAAMAVAAVPLARRAARESGG